eukprot:TRINITY_DN2838_c0_g10_i1.p1 TRINITY_DN2838_c0_g10~~TRINITY_DN2838_c0_g10_i1.p1  ORF type:complete len:613 (+),score=139.75 TRINITY_DN2838_c0_g10_i1:110-1840(+)
MPYRMALPPFIGVLLILELPSRFECKDGFLSNGLMPADESILEFKHAMETVMGCGTSRSKGRKNLAEVERVLAQMWRVAPKNAQGKVEWRMVRYFTHRYFMQRSSLLIRGLEPARLVNASHVGVAEILQTHAPSVVENAMSTPRSADGYTLDEAVALVAALEQVIFDSESALLEKAYRQQYKNVEWSLSHRELVGVIESYMAHWLLGVDSATITYLLNNRAQLDASIPHWSSISHLARGLVKSMEFHRNREPRSGHGVEAMSNTYSFDDAHETVADITKTFGSFWETECRSMKAALVSIDRSGTGRVPLSEFYGSKVEGEWRFAESEAYLLELGALDTSSKSRGKQVIIANYLQGASNCIVTTPHYYVCCANECEEVLADIEEAVGSPVATPEALLPILGNMSNYEDDSPQVKAPMAAQLKRIAETHGGGVPLHGRLFAQWLHYLMPRECPFPHKAGAHTTKAPLDFGENYLASQEEVTLHAEERNRTLYTKVAMNVSEHSEEQHHMSQWSEEEELIADYSHQLRAPWEAPPLGAVAGVGFGALLLVGGAVLSVSSAHLRGKQEAAEPCWSKAHCV